MPDNEPDFELDVDDDPEAIAETLQVVHDEPSAEEAAMHIVPPGAPFEPGLGEINEIMEALAQEDGISQGPT
jgi:hypothetical protein